MSSLWRGKDHLLYVRGSGFLIPLTEEYKRYRFADIQAISIAKKSRIGAAVLYAIGLLACAGPLALIFALLDASEFGMGSAISISIFALGILLFGSLLLRHFILGPTCVCDLQTSLSRDRIRPLNRFHAARQCLDAIAVEIDAAQQSLTPGGDGETVTVSAEAGGSRGGRAESFSVPRPVIPTFAGVILFGIGALATLHLESVALTTFLLFLLLFVSLSLTISLIASVRRLTPESIRTLLWVALGLLFVLVGTATVYLLISAARNPAYTIDFMGPLEALTGVAGGGGPGFYFVFLALSLGFFVCGISGVLTALRWKELIAKAADAAEAVDSTEEPETFDAGNSA